MSKKKQKPVTSPKKSSAPERTVKTAVLRERRPEFELIHFDRKVWIFIGACLFLFFLFVSLKWHNSSIPRWNQMVPDGGDQRRGLVHGDPLFIRSDEWLVYSSLVLSQEKKGFPVANEALGAGKTPLAFGLPTNHLISIIKPSFWGFYVLDVERGFSWQWNFRIWPFLIAAFLFLMLFTRNNFWISVFGSVWLLLSSAVQWWSINTEVFTFGFATLISFIYLIYAEKTKSTIISGIFFLISAYSYIVVLYPAYQVPMAYVLIVLLIGYLIKNKSFTKPRLNTNLVWKISTFGCSFAILILFAYLFFQETKETIGIMADTVYPGKRSEGGGDFLFLKIFTDNFGLFMGLEKYPANWGNICEASSFLMLSPVASLIIIADYIKSRKTDPVLFLLVLFQFVLLVWLLLGFPAFLAKITLFSVSPSYRAFFIFGFTNVIVTILYLAYYKSTILRNNTIIKIIGFIILFGLIYLINNALNKQSSLFFTSTQVLKSTVIFAVLHWLVLFFNTHKFIRIAFYILWAMLILPNALINPLSKGLSPYFENTVYKAVSDVEKSDPGKGWIVFGKFTYGNFVKAAGANCFNGNQCVPPMEKLKILDPEMKSDSIYNRYAHIDVLPFIDADSVKFTLQQTDRYIIKMDPCSPRLTQMGIKYIMFTYEPQPVEIECMTPVKNVPGAFVYKRNDI